MKRILIATILVALLAGIVAGCASPAPEPTPTPTPTPTPIPTPTPTPEPTPITTFTFSFDQNAEGWNGGFSDLPTDYERHGYDVEFKHSNIPLEGNVNGGLSLTGNNHSDDLFMYLQRAFDAQNGLKPNTAYRVELSFDMATNVPSGMMGIGGSPGESVYIKAGVVNREPKSIVDTSGGSGIYRMDIDKGNQSTGGEDMVVVGNASKIEGPGQGDESFQYKPFELEFQVTTDESRILWVIIGFDSGFEGIHQLYFDNISVKFNE